MDSQPPLPGESGLNSSQVAGGTLNTEIVGTQQERRQELVHRDAANAATNYITQNAYLKMIRMTRSSKNQKQHADEC
jgi:hypothetical protein